MVIIVREYHIQKAAFGTGTWGDYCIRVLVILHPSVLATAIEWFLIPTQCIHQRCNVLLSCSPLLPGTFPCLAHSDAMIKLRRPPPHCTLGVPLRSAGALGGRPPWSRPAGDGGAHGPLSVSSAGDLLHIACEQAAPSSAIWLLHSARRADRLPELLSQDRLGR